MIQKLLLNTQMIIVFDDMIADMHSNKKLNPIVTELFILFLSHNPKNSTHYFIMKIPK